MTILVTGGAGYIGSHVVRILLAKGEKVVVVDDLSTGLAARIGGAQLIKMDLASDDAGAALSEVMKKERVEAVIHFAAKKRVDESVERPDFYRQQNVGGMVNLLFAMRTANVQRLVFSSSAAVYGTPDADRVSEESPCEPVNPYGETKLIGESLADWETLTRNLTVASLRYFNVSGSGWSDLGDTAALNLIPIVFKNVTAGAPTAVFGGDYPTPDGTCVRDYVHVMDLAESHLSALEWTAGAPRGHEAFNIGTGRGASVLEIVAEIAKVTAQEVPADLVGRRKGDPARVVADVSKASSMLNWQSSRDISSMVATAWEAFLLHREQLR